MRLDINVMGAKGIPKLNPKFPQKPYCVVQIQDREEHFQTKTSMNGTNPEWNETFSVTGLSGSPITISFFIYNKEKVICSNNFDLSDIKPGAQLEDWFELTPENQSKGKPKSGGKIHFALTFTAEQEDIQIQEEEEEEEKVENNNNLMSSRSNSQHYLSPSSPLSPKMKGTRQKIENDNGDIEQIENEAKESAENVYKNFLKSAAPGLLNNSKIVQKMHEEQEEE